MTKLESRPPASVAVGRRPAPVSLRNLRLGKFKRGLGPVQLAIWRALIANGQLSTAELAGWAYPHAPGATRHKCRAIRRAAERVAVRTGRRIRPGGIVWKRKDG